MGNEKSKAEYLRKKELVATPTPQPVAWLHYDAHAIEGEIPWVLMVNQEHPLIQAKTERIVLVAAGVTACVTPPAPCPSYGRCTYPDCGHFLDVTRGVQGAPVSLTDAQAEALIEASDGHWKEDVFCIGGPELMALLRAAAGVLPTHGEKNG